MEKYSGKCHCGENTYQVKGQPEFQFICYCDDCRMLNGGGHLCGVTFNQEQVISKGKTEVYSYLGGSGEAIEAHFCPHCATTLYAYPKKYKNKVVIRANTLLEGSFKSQQNLFAETKFSWDYLISSHTA